ncbi:hypothetical protein T12_5755 [Trichinella patagoniensis]|uniref:Uncharacterized protein n=1 Tax=Trichinella patagoniensis TaxID=990121 RepID=A0A0V0ZBT6_9BILA|nr:hypothetical protein T12_4363 [Trichinella patagoniensis]KRY16146.1 hypothetical protein T12_5755 [Trichinella patagoniensis]
MNPYIPMFTTWYQQFKITITAYYILITKKCRSLFISSSEWSRHYVINFNQDHLRLTESRILELE